YWCSILIQKQQLLFILSALTPTCCHLIKALVASMYRPRVELSRCWMNEVAIWKRLARDFLLRMPTALLLIAALIASISRYRMSVESRLLELPCLLINSCDRNIPTT